MELGNNRVWDYAADNYVHRLIQNKTDGKLVQLDEGGRVVRFFIKSHFFSELRFQKYKMRRICSEVKNFFTTVFSAFHNLEKPNCKKIYYEKRPKKRKNPTQKNVYLTKFVFLVMKHAEHSGEEIFRLGLILPDSFFSAVN
jgi:hypothetical protein